MRFGIPSDYSKGRTSDVCGERRFPTNVGAVDCRAKLLYVFRDGAAKASNGRMAMFKKRIGQDPHRSGTQTANANGCPDVWELEDGRFAVIGLDMTSSLKPHLPESASCGADEQIVVIPRELLLHVKDYIPSK